MTTAWPGLATVDRARHAEQLAVHGVQRGARGSRTEHELARGQPAQLDGLPVGAVHHDAQRGSAVGVQLAERTTHADNRAGLDAARRQLAQVAEGSAGR